MATTFSRSLHKWGKVGIMGARNHTCDWTERPLLGDPACHRCQRHVTGCTCGQDAAARRIQSGPSGGVWGPLKKVSSRGSFLILPAAAAREVPQPGFTVPVGHTVCVQCTVHTFIFVAICMVLDVVGRKYIKFSFL